MRKRLLAVLLGCAVLVAAQSQTTAMTESGRTVLLHDDGTWEYQTNQREAPVDSAWTVLASTDPLSDATRTILSVRATSGEEVYGDPIWLVLRKTGEYTEVYINWSSYLGLDEITISHRIDSGNATTSNLTISTNHRASFFHRVRALDLIWWLLDSNQFIARATPYGENPITAVFPTRGLRSIVESTPHLSTWLEDPPSGKRGL